MAAKRAASKRVTKRQRTERRAAFASQVSKVAKRALGATTTSQTPLQVRAVGVALTEVDRSYARERVGFKLGKFGLAITRIGVRFSSVSGPVGGPAIECRVKILLRRNGELAVSAIGETAREAFDRAAPSAERSVRRTLERVDRTRLRNASR